MKNERTSKSTDNTTVYDNVVTTIAVIQKQIEEERHEDLKVLLKKQLQKIIKNKNYKTTEILSY